MHRLAQQRYRFASSRLAFLVVPSLVLFSCKPRGYNEKARLQTSARDQLADFYGLKFSDNLLIDQNRGRTFEEKKFSFEASRSYYFATLDFSTAREIDDTLVQAFKTSPFNFDENRQVTSWLASQGAHLRSNQAAFDLWSRFEALPSSSRLLSSPEKVTFLKRTFDSLKAKLPEKPSESSRQRRFLILTTSGGGGHLTAATGLHEYLGDKPDNAVKLVDISSLQGDAFFEVTKSMPTELIYNEFFVRKSDSRRFYQHWELIPAIWDYVPEQTGSHMVRIAKEFKPTHILSTMAHHTRFQSLAYELNVPYITVVTDHQLPHDLDALQTVHPNFFRLAVPSEALAQGGTSNVRSPLVHAPYEEVVKLYLPATPSNTGRSLPASLLYPLGFPVRKAFLGKWDKRSIRTNLSLKDDEKLVLVNYGLQGGNELSDLVRQSFEAAHRSQKKVVLKVLVGRNQELGNSIHAEYTGSKSANVRVEILGYQDAQQMAELFSASHFVVSKPGGSTTAELWETNTPLLSFRAYPWEKPNEQALAAVGLAFPANTVDEFVKQFDSLIRLDQRPSRNRPPLDWRRRLDKLLSEF